MLEVSAGGERRYGGLGVAIDRPAVRVEAEPAAELTAEGPDAGRALGFARLAAAGFGLSGGARVRVLETLPAHAGLGSGTRLGLAVGRAVATLAGREPEPAELARAVGRAERSAVGLWTFAGGGLVVEGGVRPGSGEPAPLISRHPLPADWRCVLVVPAADPSLSGEAEGEAFEGLAPAETDRDAPISQLVLTRLLPALVEEDLEAFGAALTRLQELVGAAFAPIQGGAFHPRAAPVVEALLDLGAAGAGQSSWGPAAYGVVGGERQGSRIAAALAERLGPEDRVEVAAFEGHGARVTES
jgi:beta-RFAP synthase